MRRIHFDFLPVRLARAIVKLAAVIAVPAGSALIACRDPVSPVAPKLRPITITAVAGTVATVVSPAPTVMAMDSFGRPAAGVRVTFTRSVEGTSTELATVTTRADGVASVEWRLGTKAVNEALNVSAEGYVPIWFFARVKPGPAAIVQPVDGDGQRGIAGFALGREIRVSVTDSFGNGVPGAFVEFEVEEGGGSVTGPGQFTDSNGTAATLWVLGQVGANSLRAYVRGAGEIRFSATADDPPVMPNGEKFQLNRIRFTGDYVTKVPSWLVLGVDGHFAMYVQGDAPLLAQGIYTVSDSHVRLTYADPEFQWLLWADLQYFPPTGIHGFEEGDLKDGTLVIHRCWTDDCYDTYWEYVPVP